MAVVNRIFQAMPEPTQDVASLQKALKAAIANIEILTGQRKGVPGIADQLTDLRSSTAGVNARFTEYVEVSATSDAALAQRTTTLEADMYGANGKVTSVDKARADGDSALAQRSTTIEASYKAADSYLNDQIIRVDQNAATTNARISNEESARASADSALAQRSTTIEANYKSADSYLNDQIVRVDQNAATANARITDVDTASASRDGALSERVTTLRADYNSSFAEGSIKFTASAVPTGWNVSYTIAITGGIAGGQTIGAGMRILLRSTSPGQYESAISFNTNNFLLYDPNANSSLPVFNYGGGIFTFNVPVIVRGRQLETNATQRSNYTRQNQATVSVNLNVRSGAIVAIFAQFEGQPTVPFTGNPGHTLRVFRTNADGSNSIDLIVKFMNFYLAGNNDNLARYFTETSANIEDTPPVSGDMQQFVYTVTNTSGYGISNIRVQEFFR